MTNSQERTLNEIKNRIPHFDFYGDPDFYEIKEFKVEDIGAFIAVSIVTGVKDDTGTMAALLCRKYRHGFIGKRGGVSIVNDKGNVVKCSVFDFMNKHYRN